MRVVLAVGALSGIVLRALVMCEGPNRTLMNEGEKWENLVTLFLESC